MILMLFLKNGTSLNVIQVITLDDIWRKKGIVMCASVRQIDMLNVVRTIIMPVVLLMSRTLPQGIARVLIPYVNVMVASVKEEKLSVNAVIIICQLMKKAFIFVKQGKNPPILIPNLKLMPSS